MTLIRATTFRRDRSGETGGPLRRAAVVVLSVARALAPRGKPGYLDAGGSLDARDLDRGVVLLLDGLKVGDEPSHGRREADGVGGLDARRFGGPATGNDGGGD